MSEVRIGAASDLPPGTLIGVAHHVVGNADGRVFAVSRRCRHLGADLANGSIESDRCLVCPWHASKYDVETGRMVRGPQGVFARIPGFDALNMALTRVFPLRRADVVDRDGTLFMR